MFVPMLQAFSEPYGNVFHMNVQITYSDQTFEYRVMVRLKICGVIYSKAVF